MPTISGRTVLAAGAQSPNVLLGSQYELAPFDGTIEIGVMADKNLVDLAIFSGPDVLQEPGGACPFAATETMPRYPDDYHWEDEVAKGDRLKIVFHNGNAAQTIINWVLRTSPA
jgi:hypothetical protein